jgi:hypothetical protein
MFIWTFDIQNYWKNFDYIWYWRPTKLSWTSFFTHIGPVKCLICRTLEQSLLTSQWRVAIRKTDNFHKIQNQTRSTIYIWNNFSSSSLSSSFMLHVRFELCLPLAFTLVSRLIYSSTLMMEVKCSSEMSSDFQRTTRRYIPWDRTLHLHSRVSNFAGVVIFLGDADFEFCQKIPIILTEGFRFFLQSLKANERIASEIRPRPIPSILFSIRHSKLMLGSDSTLSVMLTVLFNEQEMNTFLLQGLGNTPLPVSVSWIFNILYILRCLCAP